MKKIFSVLVVAFFLAATFSSTNNYLAFAEGEQNVQESDTEDADDEGGPELKSRLLKATTILCSNIRPCTDPCKHCISGQCIPRCNSNQRCVWTGNQSVYCASRCSNSGRCPAPLCFSCVDGFCHYRGCPSGQRCNPKTGCQ